MSRRALLAVALLAALVRVGWEASLARGTGPVPRLASHLLGDERAYDAFARQVAEGRLDRERAFYQEPLYAWLVGQLYRLAPPPPLPPAGQGDSAIPHAGVHRAVIWAQHLCGVLVALLVATLGARVLGPGVGLLAGLFAALSGPLVFTESQLLKESLALLLWVSTLHLWLDVLLDRGGARRAALLGLLLGAGILLRGNTYLLALLVGLSLLVRSGGRRRVREALLAAGCALVAISPATIHNLRRGEWVLTTYQAGTNAAIGMPDNDLPWRGIAYEPLQSGHGDALFEEDDAVALAERDGGRRLSGREISGYWWSRAWASAAHRPAVAARRVATKLAYTFHGDEIPDVKDWSFFVRAAPWLGSPLSDLSWLGPLALAGFIALPWRRELFVVRGALAVVALSLALFYVMGRYRLAAAPGLWILAAGALFAGARTLAGRASAARKAGVVLCGGALVALGQLPLRPDVGGEQVSWGNLASVELATARTAATPSEVETARAAALAAADEALARAATYPEARVLRILACDVSAPGLPPLAEEAFAEAWRLLLVLEGERTGTGVLKALGASTDVVATACEALFDMPSLPAREQFVGPALAFACRRIAQDLRTPAQWPLALRLVERGLAFDPHEPLGHVQHGLVLKRLGRLDEAEAAYRRALDAGLDTVELHNNLGNLLLGRGRLPEAAAAFERAARIDPDNEIVRLNLERARKAAAEIAPPGS